MNTNVSANIADNVTQTTKKLLKNNTNQLKRARSIIKLLLTRFTNTFTFDENIFN